MYINNQNSEYQRPATSNAQNARLQAYFPQFQQSIQGIPNKPNQSIKNGNNSLRLISAPNYQNNNSIRNQYPNQFPQQYQQQQNLQFKQQHSKITYEQIAQLQYQQSQPPVIPAFGLNYYNPNGYFGNPQSNINYADDQEIHPMDYKNIVAKHPIYDLIQNLEFSIKAHYQVLRLKKNQVQELPAIVTLKTKEVVNNNAKEVPQKWQYGEKIQMVKKTLKLLLNFLTEKDRLCLIQFDDQAQRLTKLLKVSSQNKKHIEKTIDSIRVNGGTVISAGTHIAFEQIKQRKYKNNVTSIFLLSDGQDWCGEQSVQDQLTQFDGPFTIHSFGFGQDHDAKLMTSLCNLKNGSFYFVNDISLLDEFFIDALGGLVSVVGENIQISINLSAQAPFDGLKITKTYGKMWQKLNDQNYKIIIPQIASGSRKDYVFMLSLPKFSVPLNDHQRIASVINAIVKIKSAQTGQLITKQATLDLTFFNENEQLPANEENIDVAAQYYRVKGADIIDDARRVCEQNQYQNAQVMLDTMIANINRNQKVAKASEGIIQDLVQAKQATQPQNFNRFGQQQMCQMSSNNYAQAGINANFNAQGIQQQQMQPASYQNLCQANWVGKVQQSKRQS